MTKFFCRFGVSRRLHSDQDPPKAGGGPVPRSEKTPPHYTGSRAACWSSTSKPLRTYCLTPQGLGRKTARLPPCLRGINQNTTALTPMNGNFGGKLRLPCDLWPAALCSSWEGSTPIEHAEDSVERLHDIHKQAANIWSWPATKRKPATTAWPTLWATKRAIMCGSLVQPIIRESRPIFKILTRANTG
jgi:hypothetical protein